MKPNERLVIHCTADFKARVEKALAKEAQNGVKVPNVAEKGRELFDAYCNRALLPADHPRNQAGAK